MEMIRIVIIMVDPKIGEQMNYRDPQNNKIRDNISVHPIRLIGV